MKEAECTVSLDFSVETDTALPLINPYPYPMTASLFFMSCAELFFQSPGWRLALKASRFYYPGLEKVCFDNLFQERRKSLRHSITLFSYFGFPLFFKVIARPLLRQRGGGMNILLTNKWWLLLFVRPAHSSEWIERGFSFCQKKEEATTTQRRRSIGHESNKTGGEKGL